MNTYLIAVAGGKGLRMGGDIPKQFLPIKGKPVLMRTLEAFYAYDKAIHLIVYTPASDSRWGRDSFPFGKERAGFSGGRRCFGGGTRWSTSFCVT